VSSDKVQATFGRAEFQLVMTGNCNAVPDAKDRIQVALENALMGLGGMGTELWSLAIHIRPGAVAKQHTTPLSGPGACGDPDCQHAPDGGNHPAPGVTNGC
jgi:hypothetical protein